MKLHVFFSCILANWFYEFLYVQSVRDAMRNINNKLKDILSDQFRKRRCAVAWNALDKREREMKKTKRNECSNDLDSKWNIVDALLSTTTNIRSTLIACSSVNARDKRERARTRTHKLGGKNNPSRNIS